MEGSEYRAGNTAGCSTTVVRRDDDRAGILTSAPDESRPSRPTCCRTIRLAKASGCSISSWRRTSALRESASTSGWTSTTCSTPTRRCRYCTTYPSCTIPARARWLAECHRSDHATLRAVPDAVRLLDRTLELGFVGQDWRASGAPVHHSQFRSRLVSLAAFLFRERDRFVVRLEIGHLRRQQLLARVRPDARVLKSTAGRNSAASSAGRRDDRAGERTPDAAPLRTDCASCWSGSAPRHCPALRRPRGNGTPCSARVISIPITATPTAAPMLREN